MFELLYNFTKLTVFPTLCDYAIFSLIMRSDAARGQLCEIAPAHNIRSPVLNKLLCIERAVGIFHLEDENKGRCCYR